MKEQLPQNINIPENNLVSKENDKEDLEAKSNTRLDLFGKEYVLETSSYDFEYPESIKKETGILGYKRTIIKEEEILNIVRNRCEDFGINTKECKDISSIEKLIWALRSNKRKEFGYNSTKDRFDDEEDKKKYKDYLKNTEGKFLNSFNSYFLTKNILENLSSGQYPKRTMNHSVGSNANEVDRQKYEKNFIKNKFFIQKIFDVDLTNKVTLDNRQTAVDNRTPIMFDIYNKNTNEFTEKAKLQSLHGKEREIQENAIFAVGNDAFNTSPGHFFFYSDHELLSFGFSPKDKFFKEYLQESYKFIFKNVNKDEKSKYISEIYKTYALSDDLLVSEHENVEKYIYNKYIKDNDKDSYQISEDDKEIHEKFNIIKKINIDIYNKMSLELENTFEPISPYDTKDLRGLAEMMIKNNILSRSPAGGKIEDEIAIPIFINHDKIPQLSWGHAKYAHYFNEKGFNFFEFKHADHLPQKE